MKSIKRYTFFHPFYQPLRLCIGMVLLFSSLCVSAQVIICSPAGINWTARTGAAANPWRSVTYGNGLFVAVAESGTNRVMTSPDGITWTARIAAEANAWQSVTYGNGLFVAVALNGTNRVMTSPDGENWTTRTAAAANPWQSVTYGNGLFVAIADDGINRVMTSTDGINWTARTAAAANFWRSVTYGNGLFVAVALDGTNRVMTSPNGITWTARTAAAANQWLSVTYGNGLFVAVATNNFSRVMTSPDGITWTARTEAEANVWTSVTYGGGFFVAVAQSGINRVMTSINGITWTARTAAEANEWRSVIYGNGQFVAVARNGTNRVMTSTNGVVPAVSIVAAPGSSITPGAEVTFTATPANEGDAPSYQWKVNGNPVGSNSPTYMSTTLADGDVVTVEMTSSDPCANPATAISNEITMEVTCLPDGIIWTSRTAAEANEWRSLTYGNGLFVAVANNGSNRVMTSPDGITWTARAAAGLSGWRSVTYGYGLFVAVAESGTNRLMTSLDGITWTARTPAGSSSWSSVTYGNGLFVAVASGGTNLVMTSPDGITWTARTAAAANQWRSVTYGNGLFVAIANNGTNRVMTSPNGITWTARTAAEANLWFSVTYGNGLFVAVAIDGTNRVMTSSNGISWTTPIAPAATASTWFSVTYGNGLFVAVAGSGTNRVMTSPDGINWTARTAAEANGWGSVTYGNGLFVAVTSTGTNRVMTSPNGIAWTARTAAEANSWQSVTYGNGLFVAVAQNGTNRVMTSSDGINWTARRAAEGNLWRSVIYGKGLFVAVANIAGTFQVMTSAGVAPAVSIAADPGNSITSGSAVTFTATPTNGGDAPTYQWKVNGNPVGSNSPTYTSSTLADGEVVTVEMTSNDPCANTLTAISNEITMAVVCPPDGINWTARTAAEANGWSSVTYGNGLFVAVAINGTNRVMTSPDGITWTARTAVATGEWSSVTYGNGLFVAVAGSNTNRLMTSPNGINWTARTPAPASGWSSVTYGNGLFVAVAQNGTNRVMTSSDGITWTARTPASATGWRSVTYGNGLFVAVAFDGTNRVMTSPDGITWTARTAAAANNWRSVTYGNGLFVAVAGSGTNQVMTSPDGITWTARTAAEANPWGSVTYGNGLFVAVASSGTNRVMTSPDGITWSARTSAGVSFWRSVIYGNGLFVAVASSGTNSVMTSADNCAITWTGTVNNLWNIAGNWLPLVVPTSGDDILIPLGTPELNVDFTVAGNLTINGTGTLAIAPNKTLTISGSADFGNRPVVVKSTADGTGSIGVITGTLTNATHVTVARFIPPTVGRAWRFLTIPVTSSTATIRDAWAGGAADRVYDESGGTSIPAQTAGTGTIITGHAFSTATAANTAGYDWWPALWNSTTNRGGATSLTRYTPVANSDGRWLSNVASRSTIGTLLNATDPAYMLFVRGDRTVTTGNGSTTLVPTGTLKTGTMSQAVPSTTTAKFFTYGNPYASAIDFEQLLAGNTGKIAPELWIWNAGLNGWQTVKEIAGTWMAVPGGADPGVQYIQSGQGVMLQTISATATTLTTTETYKTSGLSPITPFEVPGGNAQPGLLFADLHARSTDASLKLLDGVLAVFAQDNNRNITDAYDVAKMGSFDRDLGVSLKSSGAMLSIEGRPPVSTAWDTLYLDIPGLTSGAFALSFNAKNLAAQGAEIYLLDKHLLSTTALSNEGVSQYDFTVNTGASAMADRFSIVQRSGTLLPVTMLGIQAAQQQNDVLVSWQTASESNMSHYEVLYSRNGIDFGKAQQIEAKNSSTADYQWLHVQPGAGNHFYKINAVDKEGNHLVSKVVKVKLGGMDPAFTVYPNPLDKGNQLTLQMEAFPAGAYSLQVIDVAGRVLESRTLQYAGGSAAQVIQLPNALPPGKYFISLTGNGKQYLETVMKL